MKYRVELTADELLRLDGVVSDEVQGGINKVKDAIALRAESSLSESQAVMVVEILQIAREKGKLGYISTPIRRCECCGREGGYHTVRRSTRYKRKGEKDWDSPITFTGYELSDACVRVQHHLTAGYCQYCRPVVEPVLLKRLADIPVQVPKWWPAPLQKWARAQHYECTVCGWKGHEGEMGRSTTLMGDGSYASTCPNCKAQNLLFAMDKVKLIDGFTMIRLSEKAA